MNKSDSIAELAKALNKAQPAIKGAVKDSENPYFKSHYADLASVLEACRQQLAENGLSVAQGSDFAFSESGNVVVYLETILMHVSGEWISFRAPMKPAKDDPQGWGSVTTYYRRYGYSAAVGVAQVDDDGNEASGKPKVGTKAAADYVASQKITEGQERLKAQSEARKAATPPVSSQLTEGEQFISGVLESLSSPKRDKNDKPYVTIEIVGTTGVYKMNVFDRKWFEAEQGEKPPLHILFNKPVRAIVKKSGKFLNFVSLEADDIQIKDPEAIHTDPQTDPFALVTEGAITDEDIPF